jgi:L-asparaginase
MNCPKKVSGSQICAGLVLLTTVALCSLTLTTVRADNLPKVRVFSTGGTIQGAGPFRNEVANYKGDGSLVTGKMILDDLPEAKKVADVSLEETAAVASANTKILIELANHISDWLQRPDTSGAVVTHGTATMEETAYFLNLTVRSDKPVVVVGAMRPFTAISRDGPLNLYNAIRVAADSEARDLGVMVLLNDEIHASRDVTKTNTERVSTFVSRDLGPLGFADSDRIVLYRKLLYRHTHKSEFDVSKLTDLPKVDIAYGYQEGGREAVDAFIAAGAKGIVLDDGGGFGGAIQDGKAKGVVFVQSDRKGSGRVMESARSAERGVVTADNLNAQKARELLRLALSKTSDIKEIQRIFDEY